MKPFVWITALILSLPFLAGAAFTGFDVLGRGYPHRFGIEGSVGWLYSGLMFLSLGVRGWRVHRLEPSIAIWSEDEANVSVH